MRIKKTILFLQLLLLTAFLCFSQTNEQGFSVIFYNVENLFDTKDDPKTADEEFTPAGDRHWTFNRLRQKQLNISKVILNSAGWNRPDIVTLCEVENRNLLEQLLAFTPLKSVPYKIIHKESPDDRGIDVAMLYNSNTFSPLNYQYFPLKNGKGVLETREILYVRGFSGDADTLHFLVNHWPSRYSGLLETRQLRALAARQLRAITDSLNQHFTNPKIIIVGDFNDQPFDESLSKVLAAKKAEDNIEPSILYNLSWNWTESSGTLKYQSQWSVFDQVIVSGSLLKPEKGFYTKQQEAKILRLPFLLEPDKKYGGLKPKRTYIGFSYHGGFSDHLPVMLKLVRKD